MLVSIHVKNFAIIDEVMLDFGEGFNVLTGETGAGKSILIGSLLVALGGKVSKEMLGSRADYALVELIFESDSPELKKLFEDNDLVYEEQTVISRRISLNGRSVCRINGETVSASVLKDIASLLIDIHGQHEHQSLLYKSAQRKIVDSFSAEATWLCGEVKKAYGAYRQAADKLHTAETGGRLSQRELDLVQYELDEITGARLIKDEEDNLTERFKVLSNTDKITEALSTVSSHLSEGNTCASDLLDDALRALGKVSSVDERLAGYFDELNLISDQLGSLSAEIKDYAESISGTEEELAEVSARLDVINHLKSKYGNTYEDIMAYAADCEKKLSDYTDYDLFLEKQRTDVREKEQVLNGLCSKLTKQRERTAKELSVSISEALKELNFEHAVFEIRLIPVEGYSEAGAEEIEFYVSTNLGEPVKKLAQCASGGELSRIMLAIKSCLAQTNQIDSLVFDEIDVGISGRTAQKVSEKMAYIGSEHQVICITHLPQIAAMADTHFLIEKKQNEGKTTTEIRALEHDEMATELARMLGGTTITENVIASAREMKALADGWKAENRR
ncbi:MAG: DNA repair protein RecN [Lachnospiraceae bacterium]